MPNTPKLPEDVEKRFDEVAYDCYLTDDNYKKEIKQFLAQELATLKAQVRKEIEELKKSAAISEVHWDDDKKTQRIIDRQKMYAHNQAITDCLSIPSLKGEE